MTKERYLNLMHWAKSNPLIEKLICSLTKYIPFIMAALYFISIIFCVFMYPIALTRLLLRPFLCFTTVTVIRNILKKPRPYDVYDFIPLCGYHPGKNRSFPSRHTASAVILALEINHVWGGPLGIFCICLSIIMGIFRILCGNHFIKDVIAGILIAFIISFL